MSNLIAEFKREIATPELPDLGPGPRADTLSESRLNRFIDTFLAKAKLPAAKGKLVRSLVLLWHDHLQAAHSIAQNIENSDGGFVHGIMHRREPDYSNAKYWFRRVGRHSCFPELAKRVAVLPGPNQGTKLAEKLVRNGDWDSFAFVDACEEASSRTAAESQSRLLREIQRLEFEVLLESFCR